jgi:RHS repeat-associated protein
VAVTNFIWDELSDNVLLETDESDALTARYTNRPEQFGKLLSQYRIEDEKIVERFYHYDGQHSTRDLTDANETVTDTFIYSAYGAEVARTGTTTNPFGYKGAVGYYTNADTDDIYVRARTYEPAIGRWLSADPMGFVDGTNLFCGYFVPHTTDPEGQQIIITPIEQNLTNIPCGKSSYIKWDFDLNFGPGGAPCSGYIVQKIDFACEVIPCWLCPPLYPTGSGTRFSFWEAWYVRQGDNRWTEQEDGNITYTDFSNLNTHDNNCGYSNTRGEIRFYCKDGNKGTGVLSRRWTKNVTYGTEPCSLTPRYLPSTDDPSKADFWNLTPKAGPVFRSHYSSYDCCDCCDCNPGVAAYANPASSTPPQFIPLPVK